VIHEWRRNLRKRLRNFRAHLYFFWHLFVRLPEVIHERREFMGQFVDVALRSLSTTVTAGIFTGAIMALQFHMQLKDFGAESVLGGLNTSGTIREVGPILIAFMLAGKVGAFTSAELGTMKVTDQIQAVRCLGLDPISFFVVPRFWAVALNSVLLLVFGLVISVLGGLLAVWVAAGINPDQYLLMIARFTSTESVILAVSKSIIFGLLMGHICCANGYWAEGGTRGVGKAVKKTAVQSMVSIVLADFLISWIVEVVVRSGELS
jgi:phospholipid/cholesterol/gamma-HCH transport system permease protein